VGYLYATVPWCCRVDQCCKRFVRQRCMSLLRRFPSRCLCKIDPLLHVLASITTRLFGLSCVNGMMQCLLMLGSLAAILAWWSANSLPRVYLSRFPVCALM
jgi:hypothetical protein